MTKEKLARVLAQKHHKDIKIINSTSLAGISLTLSNHQSDIAILFDLFAEMNDELNYLKNKLENYETHQHDYDNNGVPGTTEGVK